MTGSVLIDRARRILDVLWKRRGVKLTLVGIAFVLSLNAAWNLRYPSATWRYRLSLVVAGQNETYEGSGVVEVTMWRTPQFLPDVNPIGYSIYGEALFIELGGGKNLVVTLGKDSVREYSSNGTHLTGKAFLYPHPTRKFTDLPGADLKTEIPVEWLPLLVSFQDVSDRRSYRVINPNDLKIPMNKDLRIISATVEITDDPVTTGIIEKLLFVNTPDQGTSKSSKTVSLGDWRQRVYLIVDTR